MNLVRCTMCGEIANASQWPNCPACGNIFPKPRVDERLRIPKAQREAGQDVAASNWVLALLGVMILGVLAGILSTAGASPPAVIFILSIIFFAALLVFVTRGSTVTGHEDSSDGKGRMAAGRSDRVGDTLEAIFKIMYGIFKVMSVLLIGAALFGGGLIVFAYIACLTSGSW